jgi:gas vesicle protein
VARKKRRNEASITVSASARARKTPERSGKGGSGASKKRHNAAFVVGSVFGGLAGAAAALWKTPYSGAELRSKLTGGGKATNGSSTEGTAVVVATDHREQGQSFKGKVLSTVENKLAPIVGVQLGKTANDAGSVRTTAVDNRVELTTTSMGPGAGVRPDTGTMPAAASSDEYPGAAPAYPDDDPVGYGEDESAGAGAGANVTPVDQSGGEPSRMSSPVTPASEDDAASVEDLTKPQIDLVPEAFKEEGHMKPFPKLGGNERS